MSEVCRAVRRQLKSYVQGQLNLAKSQQVHAHLSRCRVCRILAEDHTPSSALEFKLPALSLSLPAGVLALVAASLFMLYGFLRPSAPMAAPPLTQPMSGFTAMAGAGYYLELHVTNLSAAQKALERILAESDLLKATGPFSGRLYITATPRQLSALMEKLRRLGDPGIARVGYRCQWDGHPLESNACSVTLDLLR